MKKITKIALDYNAEGLSDKKIIENTVDEIMYEIIDNYDLDLSDSDQAKLEMLLRSTVPENIEWEVLEEANQEAADYEDAKRSAIYE